MICMECSGYAEILIAGRCEPCNTKYMALLISEWKKEGKHEGFPQK